MKRALPTQSPTTSSKSKLTTPPKQSPSSKKYRSAGQAAGHTSTTNPTMLGESRFNPSNPQTNESSTPYPLPPFQMKTTTQTTSTQDNDRSSVSDNDSVHSPHERNAPADDDKPKPAPGKKTRGRVKIEMQYIQNKLRRYTTFSKRKSGIMKKAYELSTLTGTQVMLLVASETGHVYTFATPKLQPMITSEAGKALIQTCLHTPEHSQTISEYDMRMSVSGYEETDLGYSMNEDDGFKTGIDVTGHLVTSAGPMPPHMMNSQVVAIPHGLVQMPFAEAQSLNAIMGPPIPHSMPTSCVSPITHSPPPSYSPVHPTSPPRTYPGSPPYSQGSHMPTHQVIMMDDLATSSPMRKSPEGHYLSHPTFDRSPSHSPMTSGQHYSVRTPPQATMYSHHGSGSPLGQHSPMGTM